MILAFRLKRNSSSFSLPPSTIRSQLFVILLYGKQTTKLSNKAAGLHIHSLPYKSSSAADKETSLNFLVCKTRTVIGPTSKSYNRIAAANICNVLGAVSSPQHVLHKWC